MLGSVKSTVGMLGVWGYVRYVGYVGFAVHVRYGRYLVFVGGEGMNSAGNGKPPPGHRFRFRVVRAGEAKLRGPARGIDSAVARGWPT